MEEWFERTIIGSYTAEQERQFLRITWSGLRLAMFRPLSNKAVNG